jgi:TorA maturation chaperone TorD
MTDLEREIETMLAMQAGITTVLAALIQKHPDYEQFQLLLTSTLERSLQGAWAQALNDRQREIARTYVEHLGALHQVTGEILPLDSLHLQRPGEKP